VLELETANSTARKRLRLLERRDVGDGGGSDSGDGNGDGNKAA
jgi:hypothetical protein